MLALVILFALAAAVFFTVPIALAYYKLVHWAVSNCGWILLTYLLTALVTGGDEVWSLKGLVTAAVIAFLLSVLAVPVWEMVSPVKWWVAGLVITLLIAASYEHTRSRLRKGSKERNSKDR